ncbi:MAG: DUF4139 domain-containing protein [Anaerolineae bacterium]
MRLKRMLSSGMLVSALVAAVSLCGQSAAPAASAQDGGPELAVYNQGVALVKDVRTLPLEAGTQLVTITDVAAQLDPTSVHFASLTDPAGTTVLEQNFEYDLVGPERLLSKYVDQQIQLVTTDGTRYAGTLLSGSGDIILRDDGGGITVINREQVRDFSFPSLPDGLITRPSLVWLLDASQAGDQDVQITYLTGGISWQANYVLLLAQDGNTLDLDGWVTLDNQSGATYENARLKLVAGDINRVETESAGAAYDVAKEMAAPEAMVDERGFFEYHLYEVLRPVTVKDNQTKQIEFVEATAVPAETFYVYDGAAGYYFWGGMQSDPSYGADTGVTQVRTMLSFATGEEGIDAQLPQGVIRVYQEDVDGSALLLGEDSIAHTPKGENVELYVGDAFDIVGERVQTDYTLIGNSAAEESYQITLRNHKTEDIEVRVVERLYRWSDWEITEETAAHTDVDSQTIEWRLPVPANGEVVLTYTVRYDW